MLRIVGLEGVARRRAEGFSLGMGQRLGIASALLGDPAVLIFDEPVNGSGFRAGLAVRPAWLAAGSRAGSSSLRRPEMRADR